MDYGWYMQLHHDKDLMAILTKYGCPSCNTLIGTIVKRTIRSHLAAYPGLGNYDARSHLMVILCFSCCKTDS